MPAEFIGFFDRDPLAVRLEDGRGCGRQTGLGELEGPDAFQFGDFLNRLSKVARPGPPEFLEQGAFEGGCGGRQSRRQGSSRT